MFIYSSVTVSVEKKQTKISLSNYEKYSQAMYLLSRITFFVHCKKYMHLKKNKRTSLNAHQCITQQKKYIR